MSGGSALDFLEETYLAANNKPELDYWNPLAKIVLESLEARHHLGMTQQSLAEKMKTRQSVVSRFENMGRVPSYDFIARMAIAFSHTPGITLYGDFMATVPLYLHETVREIAQNSNLSTQAVVTKLLVDAILGSIQKPSIEIQNPVCQSLNVDTSYSTTCVFVPAQSNVGSVMRNCAVESRASSSKSPLAA
jgi:hypothetical protein